MILSHVYAVIKYILSYCDLEERQSVSGGIPFFFFGTACQGKVGKVRYLT